MRLPVWIVALVLSSMGLPAAVRAQESARNPAPATQPATQPARTAVEAPAIRVQARELDPKRLESPRATMETFRNAMRRIDRGEEDAWGDAVATLDLSLVNPNRAPELAEKLMDVLDRLGEIDLEELPDAGAVESQNLTRFRYFPRADVHAWVWEALPNGVEGRIVLARGLDGGWRFSARTVEQLDTLAESLKSLPPHYVRRPEPQEEEHHVLDVVGPTFERTPAWGWGVLLLCIFAGLLIGRIVQGILRGFVRRKQGHERRMAVTVIEDATGPASLAMLTLGLAIGMRFIHLEAELQGFVQAIIKFLWLVALGWFLFNLVDVLELLMRRFTERTDSKLDDMVVPLVRKTLRIFLLIVFSLVVAQNVFGLNVTGWLAGLGIAGLAVSLAAQDSVRNLFGSITVFFDRPFSVGDRIKVDGFDGPVQEIGFRSTKLRTLEGNLVTIPNMKFIDSSVENVGVRPSIQRILDVTITYDTPLAKVEEAVRIVRDILAEPEIAQAFDLATAPPRAYFDALNADSLNIKVYYWYAQGNDWWGYMEHAQRVNLKLMRAYEAAGIEFAFPTRTLFMAGDPKRELRITLDRGRSGPAPEGARHAPGDEPARGNGHG